MARKYTIESTSDFLIAAVFLLGFAVWSCVDGWFPPERVQKKHPLEVAASFNREGVIETVSATAGQTVGTNHALAVLSAADLSDRIEKAQNARAEAVLLRDKAQAGLAGARTSGADSNEIARLEAQASAAVEEESRCVAALAVLRAERLQAELRSPAEGTVIRVEKKAGDIARPGDHVFVVYPRESGRFYVFNKSMAILSFIGAAICLWIHRAGK